MSAANRSRLRAMPVRRRQSGFVLFIALIVLVAMSLAGIALFRQSSSGTLVAGNLTFAQAATSGADRGVEAARAWLIQQSGAILQNDNSSTGFYSSTPVSFDPSVFNWDANSVLVMTDPLGNKISYVIHRLCAVPNVAVNDPSQQCVTATAVGSGASKGGGSYGVISLSSTIQPYFRITARAAGPRNAVSYVQTIMY